MLAARPHGESAAVLELFTSEHGRHLGLVYGGQSPKRRASLQPGNAVDAKWRGRLPEHLGSFTLELLFAHAARLLDEPLRLLALSAAMALLSAGLPECEPAPDLFAATQGLLAALDEGGRWAPHYMVWEHRLLAALGFGLPRGVESDVRAGLRLTGRILLREVLAPQGRGLPAARKRLAVLLERAGAEVPAASAAWAR